MEGKEGGEGRKEEGRREKRGRERGEKGGEGRKRKGRKRKGGEMHSLTSS